MLERVRTKETKESIEETHLQGRLSAAEAAAGDVDAAAVKPLHGYLEPITLGAKAVGLGDTTVFEDDCAGGLESSNQGGMLGSVRSVRVEC